ncbi:MAG: ATP-binding protein [Thermoleophilia bacterium]
MPPPADERPTLELPQPLKRSSGLYLRRRLSLTFAAAVIATALILALGSYLLVAFFLQERAVDEALAQSRFNLRLADTLLPSEPTVDDIERINRALATRGDFVTLVLRRGTAYVSGPGASQDLISPELENLVGRGRLAYQAVQRNGEPILVVGGRLPDGDAALYFFYPQGDREALLSRLRMVLLGTGLVLAFLGTLVGWRLSGRILRPVDQARRAASRMARGDLDVRLPEGQGEFGELSAAFNRMAHNLRSRLEELEEARLRERRFTSDVAHELRTPVAALVGEASLLAHRLELVPEENLPAETRRAAQLVVRDIGRLRRLVDDLLEISRIDAHSADVARDEIEVLEFLRRVAEARGWPDQVSVVGDAGIIICTDPRRFERIVVNLVENALKHGGLPVVVEVRRVLTGFTVEDQGAAARLGVESGAEENTPDGRAAAPIHQEEVSLSVTDFGPGIPEEHLPHVFDRFYKTDPSRGEQPGSGLGLSIAWENARLLGGELRVRSRTDEGTRFTLRLPLRRDAVCGPTDVPGDSPAS